MFIMFHFSKSWGIWFKKYKHHCGFSLGYIGLYFCWDYNLLLFADEKDRDIVRNLIDKYHIKQFK